MARIALSTPVAAPTHALEQPSVLPPRSMAVERLIDGFPVRLACGAGTVFHDIVDDSRLVRPGCLFLARPAAPGAASSSAANADPLAHIRQALALGAAGIVASFDPPAGVLEGHPDVAWITTLGNAPVGQSLAGCLAERFFDYPSGKLKLFGITGTNGKTTTVLLTQHLVQAARVRCGAMGTVFIDDGRTRSTANLTTPGAVEFTRQLATMVNHGCGAAATEMSSHALHQGRVAAQEVAVAAFTNLTRDHLDYHKTMQAYGEAKAMLFDRLEPDAWACANVEDAWASRMLARCQANVIRCYVEDAEKAWQGPRPGPGAPRASSIHDAVATVLRMTANGSEVRFEGPWGSFQVFLPLVGRHNIFNALNALCSAYGLLRQCTQSAKAADSDLCRVFAAALARCPQVPGRLERVAIDEGPAPTVLVDYAHTDDALRNVLVSLRKVMSPKGRLIALFGCGGDRDRTKRPLMARACAELADMVVVTSDNPRTEDPDAILRDILPGFQGQPQHPWLVERDRRVAIQCAVLAANPDDVVLLAGKGHEDYQIIGAVKHHFDDREEAAAALRQRRPSAAA